MHLGNDKQILSNAKMKFPTWASHWYFFPNQKAQLQFEIAMKSGVICLFPANPTGTTSDPVSLYLCSNIGGWLCFRFPSTVSCSSELPLRFNPCGGGEGFPPPDPVVSLRGRVDRRVLGSELLTLHSLAAMVKSTQSFKESLPLPPGSHFHLNRYHFFFTPRLHKEKILKAGEGNKLAIYQRYRNGEAQQESKQGMEKRYGIAPGTCTK